ncbi:hypothetical protein NQ314_010198 [Rhamnusium bicolor]|uniref:Uncharacterized protein n=1 Tax=Rhamnusium bicolor TaxID=1586634 RepID=A0AAV8XSL4_9CUCU|nr:hypothetical protein NQ314_010198 [Rhamnusium bicolor]
MFFECGHRCKANCHSGPCPNEELCQKKVKVMCKCKRIKKEFHCEIVRKKLAIVECDEVCEKKKEEERILKEAINKQQKLEEELKNRKELEKYQKMFEGKKKNRNRKFYEEEEEISLIKKYRFVFLSVTLLVISFLIYYFLS